MSLRTKHYTTIRVTTGKQRNFHGAALITDDGRKIPITETMIQASLREWLSTHPAPSHCRPIATDVLLVTEC